MEVDTDEIQALLALVKRVRPSIKLGKRIRTSIVIVKVPSSQDFRPEIGTINSNNPEKDGKIAKLEKLLKIKENLVVELLEENRQLRKQLEENRQTS